jgi:phosphate:Na+ symporter
MDILLQILTLLGAVTLFLFGLSLLSGGLQKVAGDGLRGFLASMTSNPFKQIITGIGVTAAIQSSTATTIMVVSFVNAGLLVLGQAIGVIMGAHIGTTITSWIMAVFGFSFNMADFAFPLILVGYVMMQMKKKSKQFRDVGEIIIGFALFFIGFAQLRATAQNADAAEHAINTCRNELRETHINNIENAEYNYQTGVYYIDIVYELEKMGDFMINVSQAIVKENEFIPALA